MMLEENEAILTGRDRKARNKLFRAVRDGAFDDMDDFKPASTHSTSFLNPTSDVHFRKK